MTERERLIELIQSAVDGCARHWAEVIADHLLANGGIVPPCKVGDTVYTIPRTAIRKWTVVFIGICGYGRDYMNISWYKDKHHFETRSVYWEDIGKTVFLSREEAEKALERSKG